jgi:hypothetical protein
MMWKKGVCVGLLVFLATGVSGCVIEGTYKYTGSESTTEVADLTGIDAVEMKLGSTDVDVVTQDGSDGTFIIKKTFKAREKDLGPELLKSAEITIKRDGSTLVIERKGATRSGTEWVTKGYVAIDITATLPAGINLNINAGSGDIEIDDRSAPVKIHTGSGDVIAGAIAAGFSVSTGSGDVNLKSAQGFLDFSAGSGDLVAGDIKGNVEISVGSADVEIAEVLGDVTFSSGSGDFEIGSSRGGLVAGTGSGDLWFGDHTGNADLTTSSGDVLLRVAGSEGEVKVGSSSGEVEIVIYGGDSVELDLRTSSGSITSKLPLVVKEATRKRLHGISGDGDLKVNVTTSSGDIRVRQGSV